MKNKNNATRITISNKIFTIFVVYLFIPYVHYINDELIKTKEVKLKRSKYFVILIN